MTLRNLFNSILDFNLNILFAWLVILVVAGVILILFPIIIIKSFQTAIRTPKTSEMIWSFAACLFFILIEVLIIYWTIDYLKSV